MWDFSGVDSSKNKWVSFCCFGMCIYYISIWSWLFWSPSQSTAVFPPVVLLLQSLQSVMTPLSFASWNLLSISISMIVFVNCLQHSEWLEKYVKFFFWPVIFCKMTKRSETYWSVLEEFPVILWQWVLRSWVLRCCWHKITLECPSSTEQ